MQYTISNTQSAVCSLQCAVWNPEHIAQIRTVDDYDDFTILSIGGQRHFWIHQKLLKWHQNTFNYSQLFSIHFNSFQYIQFTSLLNIVDWWNFIKSLTLIYQMYTFHFVINVIFCCVSISDHPKYNNWKSQQ
jgi:hypothetical protein